MSTLFFTSRPASRVHAVNPWIVGMRLNLLTNEASTKTTFPRKPYRSLSGEGGLVEASFGVDVIINLLSLPSIRIP